MLQTSGRGAKYKSSGLYFKRRADHDCVAGGLCKRSAAMIPFDTAENKVTAGAWFHISLNYLTADSNKHHRDG